VEDAQGFNSRPLARLEQLAVLVKNWAVVVVDIEK
jgi:hypothetical protein